MLPYDQSYCAISDSRWRPQSGPTPLIHSAFSAAMSVVMGETPGVTLPVGWLQRQPGWSLFSR